MENEELMGNLVMVNPQLKDDPVQKQGQSGMIMYADADRDDFYVTFGNNERALYSSDALLAFKKPQEIFGNLMTNARDLPTPEYKALFQVNLLLEKRNSADTKAAMALVAKHPAIQNFAMETLQKKLGLEMVLPVGQEQDYKPVRGR